MDPNTYVNVLNVGLVAFVIAVIVMVGVSMMFASQANTAATQTNRQNNKPISNGYAIPATVLIVVIFVLTVLFGFVPAILRRG